MVGLGVDAEGHLRDPAPTCLLSIVAAVNETEINALRRRVRYWLEHSSSLRAILQHEAVRERAGRIPLWYEPVKVDMASPAPGRHPRCFRPRPLAHAGARTRPSLSLLDGGSSHGRAK